MYKRALISIFLSTVLFCQSQNSKKDSLIQKLNSAKEDTLKVKILNKLGQILYASKPEEAKNYANQAIVLAKKTGNKKEESLSYKILGTINYMNGDFLRAKDLYLNALNLSIEINDSAQIGNCYRNVGLASERLSGDRETIEYYFKALKIAEHLKDSGRISTLYIDIGNALYTLGDYNNAIKYYKHSYGIESQKGNEVNMARALNNIGSVFAQQNKFDSGLKYHTMSF